MKRKCPNINLVKWELFDKLYQGLKTELQFKSDIECWNWQLGCFSNGYGQLSWRGLWSFRAHKIAYFMRTDKYPSEFLHVRHSCDNKLCCNPAHLTVGTAKENKADQIARCRHAHHENTASKLTLAIVREIRVLFSQGYTVTQLAGLYNVNRATISCISRNITWKEIV